MLEGADIWDTNAHFFDNFELRHCGVPQRKQVRHLHLGFCKRNGLVKQFYPSPQVTAEMKKNIYIYESLPKWRKGK